MNSIIKTTALALMLTTGGMAVQAFADGHTMLKTYQMEQTGDVFASEFIGMRVYSAEKDYDSFNADTRIAAGGEAEWDDIGEVNDVILGRDGSVKAVVLGIGGFIGIGERDIALPMDQIKMVQEADDEGDFFLVVNTNKDALTAAEPFMREEAMEAQQEAEEVQAEAEANMEKAEENVEAAAEETSEATEEAAEAVEETTTTVVNESETVVAEGAEATTEVAEGAEEVIEAPAEGTVVTRTEGDRPMLRTPAIEREGFTVATVDQLTTEDLTGARIYSINDEDIGEIDELIVDESGKITRAVLGIGGFIGIGERAVAVTMDELQIVRNADGSDLRVYIDATKEELEAQPAYEG